jgi:alpha-glucosidase
MNGQPHQQDWWRGGVIYQIYPRSFQDSNGDGIGDLRGVKDRLPYIAELGVDAIWISPFFKSPMKDFGYDIADYRAVDPIFGTLADFDALVDAAHAHGLKVLIDQVMSHCSDQHAWFVESRASRDNPRADWFVWADPQADGTPPNNWQSVFGGSAWTWNPRRRQYYLHNFLASQPDLDFHNPAVQDATLDTLRFWLERGVDGFRLDVVNFCFHDRELRDNPARDLSTYDPAINTAVPYAWQQHVYDKSRPENLAFLQRVRRLLNDYPGTTTIGEIGDDDSLGRIAQYTGGGDKLHMAYGFDLLGPRGDARYVHSVIERFEAAAAGSWACWPLSNHDVPRVASRWAQPGDDAAARLRIHCALQLSLRGSPCLYQGDELGLSEATLALEDLQDPFGITLWPESPGRDGCRTPMVWDRAAPQAGFSTAPRTWLPIAPEHVALAAHDQAREAGSLHGVYRRLLAWRRTQPALRGGSIELLAADDAVLAFVRRSADATVQPLLCAFNLGGTQARYDLPREFAAAVPVPDDLPLPRCTLQGQTLVLPPYGVLFATL